MVLAVSRPHVKDSEEKRGTATIASAGQGRRSPLPWLQSLHEVHGCRYVRYMVLVSARGGFTDVPQHSGKDHFVDEVQSVPVERTQQPLWLEDGRLMNA